MNTSKIGSNKQAELINAYMDAKDVNQFGNLPAIHSLRSALAKRCIAVLGMNRGAKELAVKRSVKKDDKDGQAFWANVNFAFETLWKLGYSQEIIYVKQGDIIWRRIKRNPSYEIGVGYTYALLKCSQKLEATQDYRVMFIAPPKDEEGNDLYTSAYFPVVYMSKDIWTFAHTGGSPYVQKTPNFHPWDEPFQTYKQDGIVIEKEQDPNH